MTYCCGILVREGLVMIADTRTNAGLDNVSTFRKLHLFRQPGERIMAIASSGNLSISQSVVSILTEGLENPETGELETLVNAPTMFQAAQRVGRVVRMVHGLEGKELESADVKFDVSFLFGGQIKGERVRLFMIYAAGNFIECTPDTPYLQIGEHKYGQAGSRPRDQLQRRHLRRAEDRIDFDGFDHALESRRRHADRSAGGAPRRLRCGVDLPDRAGRALFSRPARALVGGLAGRPYRHPPPALRPKLIFPGDKGNF